MPPVDAGEHLIETLFEIGPIKPVGMATGPIDDLDLLAWQINQEVWLTPWECKVIRSLSREYAGMASEAREPTCAPPYTAVVEATDDLRKRVSDGFRALARSQNEGKKKRRRT